LIRGLRRVTDIVFGPARVAIYVNGCYWHGCAQHGTRSKTNALFWDEKLARNRERDADTERRLSQDGWLVITVWEHHDLKAEARRIAEVLANRRVTPLRRKPQ
jgi:DNA mismatch endonuclease (patch repair protein)